MADIATAAFAAALPAAAAIGTQLWIRSHDAEMNQRAEMFKVYAVDTTPHFGDDGFDEWTAQIASEQRALPCSAEYRYEIRQYTIRNDAVVPILDVVLSAPTKSRAVFWTPQANTVVDAIPSGGSAVVRVARAYRADSPGASPEGHWAMELSAFGSAWFVEQAPWVSKRRPLRGSLLRQVVVLSGWRVRSAVRQATLVKRFRHWVVRLVWRLMNVPPPKVRPTSEAREQGAELANVRSNEMERTS